MGRVLSGRVGPGGRGEVSSFQRIGGGHREVSASKRPAEIFGAEGAGGILVDAQGRV